MNDRQMKYILTIAEDGNITAAAQKLFISQPSLSSLLAHVEEELGTKLFDRNVSPLSLTYAGEYFVEAAKKILSIQRELEDQISDIKDYRKGRLLVGCGPQLSSIMFPIILPTFLRENPGVQIKLFEENISVLEELLISGNLELAFTTAMIDNKLLGCVPLYDEEILLLAPASFAPSAVTEKAGHISSVIDVSCLETQPFVLFKSGHLLRTISEKIFTDFDIHPNVILETDNWETCYHMVEEGMAFTLMPYSPLKKDLYNDKINSYSIDGDYYRHVQIYYRKNTYQPKLMMDFTKTVQKIINQ